MDDALDLVSYFRAGVYGEGPFLDGFSRRRSFPLGRWNVVSFGKSALLMFLLQDFLGRECGHEED